MQERSDLERFRDTKYVHIHVALCSVFLSKEV
jgi:hypothetical protein